MKALSGFGLSVAFYLLGGWLERQYGLDPPYAYFYTGVACRLLIAPACLLAALFLLIQQFSNRQRKEK